MARQDTLPLSLPPLGLSREVAAQYLGVSPGTFDLLVAAGTMPPPKRIHNALKRWDRREIDLAFASLPGNGDESPNPFDTD